MANSCRRCNMQQWDLFAFWWRSAGECQTTWMTLKQCWCAVIRADKHVHVYTQRMRFIHNRCYAQKGSRCFESSGRAAVKEVAVDDSCYFLTRRGHGSLKSTLSHSASKQLRTPLSLRICAPYFSPNARINYELINITLRSGYFLKSLSLSFSRSLCFCVVRNNSSRGWWETKEEESRYGCIVFLRLRLSPGYELENVCRVCFSRRAIKYFMEGDKYWENAAPPNPIHAAIRGPLFLSQPARSVQTGPQKQQ